MQKITVQVKEDHLELLSRAKPVAALAELIWNALDAEADEVRVEFLENALGGVDRVCIRDNGHGLYYDHALTVFKNLGGSWKREGTGTVTRKRALHGKFGKGRFRAFALGNRVTWESVFQDGDARRAYTITGHASKPGEFDVSDPVAAEPGASVGMTVEIADLPMTIDLLRGTKAAQEVTETFALYLRQYPGVRIFYDNVPLDPANAEEQSEVIALDELVMANGERVQATLEVVEWLVPGKRGVVLCDANGFALHVPRRKLSFRGFSYTAYLKSAHCEELERQGLLQVEEMSDDVRQLLQAARDALRRYFRRRDQERATDLLTHWREIGVYPAQVDADDDNVRRVLERYAGHLGKWAEFAETSDRNKGLVLRLVRELIQADPVRVARVLDAYLTLPSDLTDGV